MQDQIIDALHRQAHSEALSLAPRMVRLCTW